MIYFKLKSEVKGIHIHEHVFSGPDKDHFALCGTLIFSHIGEWQVFGAALRLGQEKMKGHVEVILEGDEEVVKSLGELEK